MSRFNIFLHRTGERLALPKATRSLILVEIAADLEDLFNHYVQEGLSEDEAAARLPNVVLVSFDVSADRAESSTCARLRRGDDLVKLGDDP